MPSVPLSTQSAVALFDYEGDSSAGDLSFHAGDVLHDVTAVSDEWMSGRIGQQSGTFPGVFVRLT